MGATQLRSYGPVNNYVGAIESWKALHDEASTCIDFEELLALGNSAFELIDRWDVIWHQKVHAGSIPYDAEHEQEILNLYKLWMAPSEYVLQEIGRFERNGYELVGAKEFRKRCEDGRGLMSSDDDFFGEELRSLQDQALTAHRDGETEAFEELGD